MLSINQQAFFALVRAGLWEKEVRLSDFKNIDYNDVYRLAEEQSVVGLVAAGLEHLEDAKIPQEITLLFVGSALQLEHRNRAMNDFIRSIVEKMRRVGIYTLLIKGQGIAQSYERPLWRACGDVDFLLSADNYEKAKSFMKEKAQSCEAEVIKRKHLEMTVDGWTVELHGTLRGELLNSIDKCLDEVTNEIFCSGNVRSWMNDGVQVFLPGKNEDVIIVFTHILHHFSQGGVGLRQICDLCRLLWLSKGEIKIALLESRLKKMGLLRLWKTLGSLMVNHLGLPEDCFPLYDNAKKYKKKADKVLAFVIEVGNMGHNRDTSYLHKYPYIISKIISFGRESYDALRHFTIFPMYSLCVWCQMTKNGVVSVIKGR